MGACGCTPAEGHAPLLDQPAGGIQSAPTAATALAMRNGGCCRFSSLDVNQKRAPQWCPPGEQEQLVTWNPHCWSGCLMRLGCQERHTRRQQPPPTPSVDEQLLPSTQVPVQAAS